MSAWRDVGDEVVFARCSEAGGLLVWLGVNFILYGVMDNLNLTATIVDGLLAGVLFGTGGAVISATLGKTSSS